MTRPHPTSYTIGDRIELLEPDWWLWEVELIKDDGTEVAGTIEGDGNQENLQWDTFREEHEL